MHLVPLIKPNDPRPLVPALGSAFAPKAKPYTPSWQIRALQLNMSQMEWIQGGYAKDGWQSPFVVEKQSQTTLIGV